MVGLDLKFDDLGSRLRCDVAKEDDWQRVFRFMRELGGWDILVNNAGISGRSPGPSDVEHVALKDWQAVLDTNLTGCFLGCQTAIRVMRAQSEGGVIINIGSRSGIQPRRDVLAYAASKAAVRHLTRSVALYCQDRGYDIRCNCVNPGSIATPMWEAFTGAESIAATTGTPADVAKVVAFLSSRDAPFVTGAEISVDGGGVARAERS